MSLPSDYSLPHDQWREGQEQALDWCLGLEGHQPVIIEAPTGSGKTSLPAAVSTIEPVLSLCRTKNLQEDNYGQIYGFDVLFGKGNYPCVNGENSAGATCADCIYPEKMQKCPDYDDCSYIIQRDLVRGSGKGSLNYAYYLTSGYFRDNPRKYLFCDECHQLSDLVLGWAGCTIDEGQRSDWWLPEFPVISEGARSDVPCNAFLVSAPKDDPVDVALKWLEDAVKTLDQRVRSFKRLAPFDEESRDLARKGENLQRKLEVTQTALLSCEDGWYIKAGPGLLYRRERMVPGLLIRPLTARHHFSRYFLDPKMTTVMMSATVGNFGAFAAELGLPEYADRRVPNVWAADRRPVYVLDAPKMGYRSGASDYERQADVIADAILDCPSKWSGIIHVTRKREAGLLAGRLARRGLASRIWKPPEFSTTYQANAWEKRKRSRPGSIMVAWSFWEGFDGLDERICIAAKTPFPSLGDPYEVARQRYSGKFYLQRTAWKLEQALGRTRRGRDQDYDVLKNGVRYEQRGLVAIADGNFKRVQKYLSQSLRESIRTL